MVAKYQYVAGHAISGNSKRNESRQAQGLA